MVFVRVHICTRNLVCAQVLLTGSDFENREDTARRLAATLERFWSASGHEGLAVSTDTSGPGAALRGKGPPLLPGGAGFVQAPGRGLEVLPPWLG